MIIIIIIIIIITIINITKWYMHNPESVSVN